MNPDICNQRRALKQKSYSLKQVAYAITYDITYFVDDDSMVLALFPRFAPAVRAIPFHRRKELYLMKVIAGA